MTSTNPHNLQPLVAVDDHQKVRDKITELIALLPTMEQTKYETFLMVQQIREEMMATLGFEDSESRVIQAELETCKKKMEAARLVIEWDETMSTLYDKLLPSEQKNFQVRGAGLRVRKKQDKTDQIKTRLDAEKARLEAKAFRETEQQINNTNDETLSESLAEED